MPFLLAFLVAGCGFHLRGFNDMPQWLNNVAISIQHAHRDLGPTIKEQLESYKIKVNPNPTEADYVLVIESDGIQQQTTNVSASTTPRQYLLIYDVKFSLVKVKGAVVIPSTHVSVSRQLTVNNDRILGSNFEEMQLTTEMRREAAMQIMNRLSRYKSLPAIINLRKTSAKLN
ncbi:MAG: hypothetical protein H0U73_10225 [Tatlockia sp.]|nr:hypothetical protein [Tatlockia sp.]